MTLAFGIWLRTSMTQHTEKSPDKASHNHEELVPKIKHSFDKAQHDLNDLNSTLKILDQKNIFIEKK